LLGVCCVCKTQAQTSQEECCQSQDKQVRRPPDRATTHLFTSPPQWRGGL
jgi:hypothetical protein